MKAQASLINQDGELFYQPNFLNHSYLEKLINEIHWRQNEIKIYGKTYLEPRLTAWFGPQYKYSSIQWEAAEMPEFIEDWNNHLSNECDFDFNAVLINYYRNGQDAMGWHRDNEKEIDSTCIASLSFGASRIFKVRHKLNRETQSILLEDKSLLLMKNMQSKWEHSLPRSAKIHQERINLTFRRINQG